MSSRFSNWRSKQPESASDIIANALNAPWLKAKAERYAAFEDWPAVVGDEIASISVPEKILRGNILIVKVIDATWAQELSLRKDSLIADIRALPRGAVIEDIRFITGSPKDFNS